MAFPPPRPTGFQQPAPSKSLTQSQLPTPSQPRVSPSDQYPPSSSWLIPAIVYVVAVVIAMVGIFFYLKSRSGPVSQTNSFSMPNLMPSGTGTASLNIEAPEGTEYFLVQNQKVVSSGMIPDTLQSLASGSYTLRIDVYFKGQPHLINVPIVLGDGGTTKFPDVQQISSQANNNDPAAEDTLGNLYDCGISVNRHVSLAVICYQKSADQGYAQGQADLGVYYCERGNPLALTWLQKAADEDNADAETDIGFLYLTGSGVDKNLTEADAWFKKGFDQSELHAAMGLGLESFIKGDYEEAMRWLQAGAAAGDPTAMNFIGTLYKEGKGVPKSDTEALNWYKKAASLGSGSAMLSISGMNVPDADNWHRKAYEKGDLVDFSIKETFTPINPPR